MAREKFCFWLNLEKEDEFLLADHIFELKQERSFASTIRDGICLIRDLRAGRLEMLFALFPWVEETLYQRFSEKQSAVDHNLQAQLSRLEHLFLEQGHTPMPLPAASVGERAGGPKSLVVPQAAAPIFDDDEEIAITVKKAKVDGMQVTKNFLDSVMRLQNYAKDNSHP